MSHDPTKEFSPNHNAPEFHGWKPPIMYDVTIDGWRLVSQQDVDHWELLTSAYGEMRSLHKKMQDLHDGFIASSHRS